MEREFSPAVSEKNCFSFIRYLLAFSIFYLHFGILTLTKLYWPISMQMRVGGFFIISGFLITRSFYRSTNLTDYTIKRIKRIVPPYVIVILLCAVLFSFISTLSFKEYFTSPGLYKYIAANLSFLNFLQPSLPGVFTANEYTNAVNGSLWIIKVEIMFYILVPVLAFLLRKQKRPVYLLGGLYLLSVLSVIIIQELYDYTGNGIYILLNRQIIGQLRYFISGMIILFYFDWFKSHKNWLIGISLLVVIANYFMHNYLIDALFPFSYAIILITFAYTFKKLAIPTQSGDFSYSFFLCHFPVIQFYIQMGWFQNKILLFIMCFITTLFLSVLSWNLIEKKVLKRK